MKRNFTETSIGSNGDKPSQGKQGVIGNIQPCVISNPRDVASFVLMQVGAINAKKDELTLAIKGLADLAKQLDFRTDAVFQKRAHANATPSTH
jgi:hypothetical protein